MSPPQPRPHRPTPGAPRPPRQPILIAPAVVRWILGVTVGAHLVRLAAAMGWLPQEVMGRLFLTLAFIPARYTHPGAIETELPGMLISPVGHTLIHGGWLHLLTNMGFLLAFGTAVARRMGPAVFLLLYALSAVGGVALFAVFSPYEITPLVGASGAIFGVLGALLRVALYPPSGVAPAPPPFHHRRTAFMFAGAYLAINIVLTTTPALFGVDGGIAWEAHLGGFIAGFLLMPFLDGRGRPT